MGKLTDDLRNVISAFKSREYWRMVYRDFRSDFEHFYREHYAGFRIGKIKFLVDILMAVFFLLGLLTANWTLVILGAIFLFSGFGILLIEVYLMKQELEKLEKKNI